MTTFACNSISYSFLKVDARCLCCRSVRRDESVHLFHSEALFGPAGYRSDLGRDTHISFMYRSVPLHAPYSFLLISDKFWRGLGGGNSAVMLLNRTGGVVWYGP
jgi:hypothetical protein